MADLDQDPLRATSRRSFLSAAAVGTAAVAVPIVRTGNSEPLASRALAPQRPDRELRQALGDIEARRIEATILKLVSFGTRHTLSSQTDPARGIGAARDWIASQMRGYAAASEGRMSVEVQSFVQPAGTRIPVDTVISNVITTLRGDTDPNRVYVVSAHYDSRVTDVLNGNSDAPGADDDGSGVAAVLEMIRVMSTRRSRATIIFATVAGEEQNLFGSAHMAQVLKAAGTDIQGMFTNDIIGSSVGDDGSKDPFTVRLFAEGVPTSETPAQASIRQSVGGENDSPSRQLARFTQNVAQPATDMTVRIIYRRDRYLRGGDHISYLQQGYPAARFTEPRENFAHQHQDVRVENGVQFGDLPQFCDFGYIRRVAQVNLATLWSLAQGPGTPKNALVQTAVLTNTTTLTWTRAVDADLAGYEVVWRETTAPDWTHTVPVGDVTTATIDLSKDNVFFGVRAVDKSGRHSPAAFPSPST
jgi:Zn-dependent M28 family amino/carboxypeptidase